MDVENTGCFSKTFNELYTFRKANKYCDLNIVVDGKNFPCHRAVLAASCKYFDLLLNSGFKESTELNVSLNDIDVETFEKILDFIYTGKIKITSENVCRLLKNSHFFGLQNVEDICVEYIQKGLPIDNLLETYVFIILIKKETVKWILLGRVVDNFASISTSELFADVPFDVFESILMAIKSRNNGTKNNSKYMVKGNLVLRAIMHWMEKDPEERKNHVRRLLEFVPLGFHWHDILEELLMGKLAEKHFQLAETEANYELTKSMAETKSCSCSQEERDDLAEPTMNVYIKENNEETFSNVHLLTLNKERRINWEKRCCSMMRNFKTTLLNGKQYFLINTENGENRFWCTNEEDNTEIPLKSPPEIVSDYSLVSANNCIYMYDNKEVFSQEKCKLYAYMSETDKWVLVSQEQNVPRDATMVALSDKLYMVGGSKRNTRPLCFDCRTHKWFCYNKEKCFTDSDVAACVYEGKIFVSGGYARDGTELNVLDLVADKWMNLESMRVPRVKHMFIPFKNHLWAVGGVRNGTGSCNMNAEVYSPEVNVWSEIVSIPSEIQEHNRILKINAVTDVIVV